MKKISTLILLALLPLVASAYDAEIDGICYNFSGNTATVTYRNHDGNNYSGEVVIPETVTYDGMTYRVTAIGDNAFVVCSDLTSVTIPGSVTSIGGGTFSGCTGLTAITIPEGVTSIGKQAFRTCTGLTSVTIPGSVKSFGESAFAYCSGLTSVIIGSGVKGISVFAFSGCNKYRCRCFFGLYQLDRHNNSDGYDQYRRICLF